MLSLPHGGTLINQMLNDSNKSNELIMSCIGEVELNERQLCDVECIINGAFSPLTGFMTETEYLSVVEEMKFPITKNKDTPSSVIFGLPVVFDISDSCNAKFMIPGNSVLLKYKHLPIAVFQITSQYTPNKIIEAVKCYNTTSIEHPAVHMIMSERGNIYCGGDIIGINKPLRDIPCRSPSEVRSELLQNPLTLALKPEESLDVIAFQCRNPIHRAHHAVMMHALANNSNKNALVLVHPTIGPTQHDDIPGLVRYETYKQLSAELADSRLVWDYLPYNMHMGGPREAIQHMIIRKNYGCTHFIIGRDMAGCKSSLTGRYNSYTWICIYDMYI